MSAGCHGSSNIAKTRGHAKAAGTSSSPRPPRSTSLLVGAVDLQRAVAPVDLVMEVLEDLDGATRGQAPRAMQDVVLERGPDLRPPRRDRALEVLRHHRGERREAALGIVEQRPRGVRDRRRPRSASRPRARPARAASRARGPARRRARPAGSWGAAPRSRARSRGATTWPAGRAARSRSPPGAGAPRAPMADAASARRGRAGRPCSRSGRRAARSQSACGPGPRGRSESGSRADSAAAFG